MHVWDAESMTTPLVWSGLCGLLGLYRRTFRGTTLFGVYVWCCIAAVFPCIFSWGRWGNVVQLGTIHDVMAQQWSASLSLAPIVALLGAKRPQNKAWNWIVVSAVAVLLLPAIETWLYRSPRPLGVSLVRNVLPWTLVGVGVLNYLGTANYWRGLLGGVAVSLPFFQSVLPAAAANRFVEQIPDWIPPTLLVCAVVPPFLKRPSRKTETTVSSASHELHIEHLNAVWRRFRDWYGMTWSLYVLDRICTGTANSQKQPSLGWGWNGVSRTVKGACGTEHEIKNPPCSTQGGEPMEGTPYGDAARELRMRLAPFVNEEFFGNR
jgi:hypothetical protein